MSDTLLPQLKEPDARDAVAEAVMALFARWGLHEVNQAQLLSLSSVSKFKHKIRQANTDTMVRLGNLLAIDRALFKRFPADSGRRDQWIFTANENLEGLTPLAVMLDKGLAGIEVVRGLAEAR